MISPLFCLAFLFGEHPEGTTTLFIFGHPVADLGKNKMRHFTNSMSRVGGDYNHHDAVRILRNDPELSSLSGEQRGLAMWDKTSGVIQ